MINRNKKHKTIILMYYKMGWYVTCDICGEQGKYGLNCNCYHQRTIENVKLKIGATILDAEIKDDYIHETLQTKDGKIIYMITCISGNHGEYEDHEKVVIVEDDEDEESSSDSVASTK